MEYGNFGLYLKFDYVSLLDICHLSSCIKSSSFRNLAILLCATATPDILAEFQSTEKLASTLLVSIWKLGEVVGPLVIAPLSETYGRLPIYHTFNMLFVMFSVVAARSTSMGVLIAMRFFLGLSIASTVINPCIVGDMFREQHRGKALSIMGMIPFIAPVLGPSIGGAISQTLGWRWTFWIVAIMAGPLQVLFLVTFRESYRVRILNLKANKLRKETGNPRLRSRYEHSEIDTPPPGIIRNALLRPLKLLVNSPVVLLVGVVSGIGMSLFYVIITSLPDVYATLYDFSKGTVGLTYWCVDVLVYSNESANTMNVLKFIKCRYDYQHPYGWALRRLVSPPQNPLRQSVFRKPSSSHDLW
jgi:MFS family permease